MKLTLLKQPKERGQSKNEMEIVLITWLMEVLWEWCWLCVWSWYWALRFSPTKTSILQSSKKCTPVTEVNCESRLKSTPPDFLPHTYLLIRCPEDLYNLLMNDLVPKCFFQKHAQINQLPCLPCHSHHSKMLKDGWAKIQSIFCF